MRDMLAMGPREDRAIAYLLVGCLLIFVAQWPRLSRIAFLDGVEFDRLVAYEFVSWMIVWPLIFYAIAALLHGLMLLFRQPSRMWSARIVLFWSVLATSPVGLLYGLASGLIGVSPGTQLVGAIWLGALVLFVAQGLREARGLHG
ncbi:hypothetical protein LOM8899_01730 [Flavimaricola marinus]|uniref:Yip1 domain protein n=2 Tax=Flavimaricola marinus TaxID=1819565 RepID=A0A238LDG6_9RHOB|nr:hypothetical protein LOM8899_01730 [Flavimaricola marinus]